MKPHGSFPHSALLALLLFSFVAFLVGPVLSDTDVTFVSSGDKNHEAYKATFHDDLVIQDFRNLTARAGDPAPPKGDEFRKKFTDQEWNSMLCHGTNANRYFSMSIDDVNAEYQSKGQLTSQAKFNDYADLTNPKNGWTRTTTPPPYIATWGKMRTAITSPVPEGLGLSDDISGNGPWKPVKWSQNKGWWTTDMPQESQIADKGNMATGGYYDVMYNVQEGAIMAIHRVSPAISAFQPQGFGGRIPGKFPDLSRVSDVLFLEWAHLAGDQIKNLKYLISVEISNPATNNLIAWIIAQDTPSKTDVPVWPGIAYDPWSSSAGKLLLGSPNCRGLAYMIYQHKQQFGNKKVKSITVFKGDVNQGRPPQRRMPNKDDHPLYNIHLIMELADV